jgi:hypothetical protein
MKVSAIVNTMNTYNGYIQRINLYKNSKVFYKATDNEEAATEMQAMIDDESYKLGKFLDTEV